MAADPPARWKAATRACDKIAKESGGGIILNHAAVFDLNDVVESYDELVGAGTDMVIVDYAQFISTKSDTDIRGRSEEVANELRSLTHKHNVVTVALSQFNRDQKLSNDPPTRHGLQGGSAWENNANQIVLLNHTLCQRTAGGRGEYTELIGDKNRHGIQPWTVPVRWDWETMRCEEYVPGTDARERGARKRGGGLGPVSLDELQAVATPVVFSEEQSAALLVLDDVLRRLERLDPRQSRVVECRFFGGLTIEETAVAIGISPRTVKRDWAMAQAWLHQEMRSRP